MESEPITLITILHGLGKWKSHRKTIVGLSMPCKSESQQNADFLSPQSEVFIIRQSTCGAFIYVSVYAPVKPFEVMPPTLTGAPITPSSIFFMGITSIFYYISINLCKLQAYQHGNGSEPY